MRVLPAAQHVLRQTTLQLTTTAFPSAIRTLASIIASITMVITIYLGYRKCMRGRNGSFTSERSQDRRFGIPLMAYDESGAHSDEFLPVYVGDGRYVYVSRNELPRDPPHIVRGNLNVPPRFDASTLKQFEAINEEKRHSCPICLEELQVEPVSAGQCLHLMHNSCLTSWLNKDINSNCPVCRVRIEESASLDRLRGRVIDLPSVGQSPSETNVDLSMETEPEKPDDVRLPMTGNVASIQMETEAAPQTMANEPIESSSENNGEPDDSRQEHARRLSMNDGYNQPGTGSAGTLPMQDETGALSIGVLGRMGVAGNEQEVAVANK